MESMDPGHPGRAVTREIERTGPAGIALFLDFDGTLVDIARTPGDVVVPATLTELLSRLERALGGALAIVTGRRVTDIDRFLAPLRPIVAGGHGSEFRTGPTSIVLAAAPPLDRDLVEEVLELARRTPGSLIEPKAATLALHYREIPEAAAGLEAELRRILAGRPDHLELSCGRRVFEICPRRVSKGAAIERLSELPAFRGRRPIMIGDDVTDDSAFEAVERAGGVALRVAGETFAGEIADFADPAAVRRWLRTLLERIER
jgi:trehalose 6-phosphate phosphatase